MSRSARAAGAAFSPLTMVTLALVGVIALAGLGTLSAYAPELKTGDDGGTHALSNASIGFGGIARLLRLLGEPVTLSRGRNGQGTDDSLLILTPSIQTDPDRLHDEIGSVSRNQDDEDGDADFARLGPTLVVLPKWSALPETRRHGWVSTAGTFGDQALRVLPEDFRKGAVLAPHTGSQTITLTRPDGTRIATPIPVSQLQTLAGPGWIPVVTDQSGAAVLAMRQGTRVYVLSDPDLINTQALKTLAGAQAAVSVIDLMRTPDTPVIFDLTLHGFQRTRSLLRLMLEPPLLGLTLVLAGLAALAGFQAAARFGPAAERGRTVALGKRALADNTAGLIRLARREHRMAAPYAALTRAMVARAISAPRTLSEPELNAFLDRVGVTVGTANPYSTLAARAETAASPKELMQVARDLFQWQQEMTRGHS